MSSVPIEVQERWPHPLLERCTGTPNRLQGVDVFTDFVWYRGSNQFVNGQNLSAAVVRAAAKVNKTPGLLLTRAGELQHFQTERWFVSVLPFDDCQRRYLTAEGAFGYLWGPAIKGSEAFLATHAPEQVEAIINSFLTSDNIVRFVKADVRQMVAVVQGLVDAPDFSVTGDLAALLEQLARKREGQLPSPDESPEGCMNGSEQHTAADLVGRIGRLRSVHHDLVAAMCGYLENCDSEDNVELLTRLMASPMKSVDGGVALGQSLEHRIALLRNVSDEYNEKILTEGETAMQMFIEARPWILGLQYARIKGRRELGGGKADFLLERFDGGYDVVELKSPQDLLVKHDEYNGDVPPAPSSFHLSDALANALAQALCYKQQLRSGNPLEGISSDNRPKILVVLGRRDRMRPLACDIVADLNQALRDVEIITFDEVGNRARGLIANIENYLRNPVIPSAC